jgi:hypothetical protein
MSRAITLLLDMSLWCGQGKLYLCLKLTACYADVPFEELRITTETFDNEVNISQYVVLSRLELNFLGFMDSTSISLVRFQILLPILVTFFVPLLLYALKSVFATK